MGTAPKQALLCLMLLLMAAAVSGQPARRAVGLVCEQPAVSLPDFSLMTLLDRRLASFNGLTVVSPEIDTLIARAPDRRFNLDSLTAWGAKTGCRYILYLQIDDRGIATRKQTSIPFLLSRYVVEGRLSGTYVLVDVDKARLIGRWSLHARVTGPRRWQAADDYPDDPDLFVTAPRRLELLRTVEERAADEIMARVQPHLRGR
jgi:hypothetical protein